MRVWSTAMTRDKTAVFAVEEAAFSKTEEGEAGQKWDQEHACHFFDIRGVVHQEFVPQG